MPDEDDRAAVVVVGQIVLPARQETSVGDLVRPWVQCRALVLSKRLCADGTWVPRPGRPARNARPARRPPRSLLVGSSGWRSPSAAQTPSDTRRSSRSQRNWSASDRSLPSTRLPSPWSRPDSTYTGRSAVPARTARRCSKGNRLWRLRRRTNATCRDQERSGDTHCEGRRSPCRTAQRSQPAPHVAPLRPSAGGDEPRRHVPSTRAPGAYGRGHGSSCAASRRVPETPMPLTVRKPFSSCQQSPSIRRSPSARSSCRPCS